VNRPPKDERRFGLIESRARHSLMRRALFLVALLVGCDRHAAVRTATGQSASTVPVANATPLAPNAKHAARGAPCGELGCAQFDSPGEAFLAAVAGDARVVAIGEAHAQKGTTVPSAAKRFTEQLLPLLAGRASDLLVELMMPPPWCADAAMEVKKKQASATSQQAPTNQSEYVAMGERARALGIVPDMLRPSCADMDVVNRAGEGAVEASLEMIARLTVAQAGQLIERDARSDADRDKAVVIYGGMLHNDLDPPPERAKWTYAPALDAKAQGKIVAVDLVVPELIVDDAVWRAFAWFGLYDRARLGGKTTLFRPSEKSSVLVFPKASP
jgi:hypothetical protein